MKSVIAIFGIFFLIHNCVSATVSPNGTLPLGVWIDGNTPTTGFYSFFFSSTVDDEISLELTATGVNVGFRLLDNDGTLVFFIDSSVGNLIRFSFCSDQFPTRTGMREVQLRSITPGSSFPYQLRMNVTNGLIVPGENSALFGSTSTPHPADLYYVDVPTLDDPLRIFLNLIQFPTPMNPEAISIRFGQCVDNFFSNNDFFGQYDHTTPFPLLFEISNSTVPSLEVGRYYIGLDISFTDLTYGIGACFGDGCNVTFISNPTSSSSTNKIRIKPSSI